MELFHISRKTDTTHLSIAASITILSVVSKNFFAVTNQKPRRRHGKIPELNGKTSSGSTTTLGFKASMKSKLHQ